MKRVTQLVVLLACYQDLGCASKPTASKVPPVTPGSVYELRIERDSLASGARLTQTITRVGSRERIESRVTFFGDRARERNGAAGTPGVSTTLYDFAAHKVYWVGDSLKAAPGGCAWGNYRSARAPVDEDPVTGTLDTLKQMAEGRARQSAGAIQVHGMPAHVEVFMGGNRPTDPERVALWPTRVFLAEASGTLLKAEAEGAGGKPTPLFEVTQLTFGVPPGTSLEPPKGCVFGNSDMDDTGTISSHAEMSAKTQASASADFARDLHSSKTAVTSSAGTGDPQGKFSKVELSLAYEPSNDRCGQKLVVTGLVDFAGKAKMISYRFVPNVEGVVFPTGPSDSLGLDPSSEKSELGFSSEARFEHSLNGEVSLEVYATFTDGQRGPLQLSKPVPLLVTCAVK